MSKIIVRTGIGQDSHRYLPAHMAKPCVLGGYIFEETPGFQANSDGDVILHALCNALTSLTGITILGKRADELLETKGITDSRIYLQEALSHLGKQEITHVAITIEAKKPNFLEVLTPLRQSIADAMRLSLSQIGLTATSGEGLTDFGLGEGLQCFCVITTMECI